MWGALSLRPRQFDTECDTPPVRDQTLVPKIEAEFPAEFAVVAETVSCREGVGSVVLR